MKTTMETTVGMSFRPIVQNPRSHIDRMLVSGISCVYQYYYYNLYDTHMHLSSIHLTYSTTMKANGDSLAGATSVRVAPRPVLARPTDQ